MATRKSFRLPCDLRGFRRAFIAATVSVLAFFSTAAFAKDDYKIAWSIYVGWMPWDYAAQAGIVDKWAEKYGITIEVVQFNDYIESINQYTVGAFDGCTMTNMDALTIPAAGGVDSTALIVGDVSNGNDAQHRVRVAVDEVAKRGIASRFAVRT